MVKRVETLASETVSARSLSLSLYLSLSLFCTVVHLLSAGALVLASADNWEVTLHHFDRRPPLVTGLLCLPAQLSKFWLWSLSPLVVSAYVRFVFRVTRFRLFFPQGPQGCLALTWLAVTIGLVSFAKIARVNVVLGFCVFVPRRCPGG